MNESLNEWFSVNGINPWLYTAMIFIVVMAGALILRRVLWNRFCAWVHSTDRTWDDQLLDATGTPIKLLIFVAAFGIAAQSAPEPAREHPLLVFGVRVVLIVTAIWLIERLVSFLIRSSALPESITTTTRTLLLTIVRVFIIALGGLIVLDTIGVSITPLLASLGVGSVAVALALQDTLSNFFSGVYLLADRPIRLGDYVEVDDVAGFVIHVGWRSTRIRELGNNVVILPNAKIAGARIKNFDLYEPEQSMVIQAGVAYDSDLEKVERVTVEVAKEVMGRVPGSVTSFEPFIRFHTFADSSINFSIILRIDKFTDNFLLKHEFIKALQKRFASDGINIPFPQRVLHFPEPLEALSPSKQPSGTSERSRDN